MKRWVKQAVRLVMTVTLLTGSMGGIVKPGVLAAAEGLAELSGPVFDHSGKLQGYSEPGWYENNIPFIDLPDTGEADTGKTIEEIYYYRWYVNRILYHYSGPEAGYRIGLFAPEQDWVGPNSYRDMRWMLQKGSVESEIKRGMTAQTNPRYADVMADNLYQYELVAGDMKLLEDALPDLIHRWHWADPYYDEEAGLYWHQPVWDATENTIASKKTDFIVPQDVQFQNPDPFLVPLNTFFGGWGYNAVLNSYQAADAKVIARIAQLAGKNDIAEQFSGKAAQLSQKMVDYLWDNDRSFYYHVMKDNEAQGYKDENGEVYPAGTKLEGREIFGYTPWQFDLAPDEGKYAKAWEQLFDEQGFKAPYGPTTSERRDPDTLTEEVYDPDLFNGNCCRWSGPTWPYSSARTLLAFGNLLNDYENLTPPGESQPVVTKDDYLWQLQEFAKLQHKDGKPYTAEAADPLTGQWIYDEEGRSNHNNQYPYVDQVLNGLIGVRPEEGNSVTINPLTPDSWDYFAAEQIPYHGHLLTIVWDKDGTHYGKGAGFRVYEDNKLVYAADKVGKAKIDNLSPAVTDGNVITRANWAAYKKADASYKGDQNGVKTGDPSHWTGGNADSGARRNEDPANAVDGTVLYDKTLRYAKWSTVNSPNASDWISVDFGQEEPVDEVKLYFSEDAVTRAPEDFDIQIWSNNSWQTVQGAMTPVVPKGEDVTVLKLPELVRTSKIKIVFPDGDDPVGLYELEAWGPLEKDPVSCQVPGVPAQHYEAEDALISMGSVRRNDNACGGAFVGGLDTDKITFVDDWSKVEPGDFSKTRTGQQWQGFTDTSYVRFIVNVPQEGLYTMAVRYANGIAGSTAVSPLAINEASAGMLEFPATGAWSDQAGGIKTVTKLVRLEEGRNAIAIKKGNGYFELDAIDLIEPSNAPPAALQLTPEDDSVKGDAALGLSMTFTKPVTAVSGKAIKVFKSDGTLLETIQAADPAKVTVTSDKVKVKPSAAFDRNASYYVLVDEGAFEDETGLLFAGIDSPSGWNFKTNPFANPSFESALNGWTAGGTAGAVFTETFNPAYDGDAHATFWSNNAYQASLSQTASGLADGYYTLKVRTKSGGSHNHAVLSISGYGGEAVDKTVPDSSGDTWGKDKWGQLAINDIHVTSGELTLSFMVDTPSGGHWLQLDDVELTKSVLPDPPAVTLAYPADDSDKSDPNSSLRLVFSNDVKAQPGKSITIYKSDGTVLETIAASDISKVKISGSNVRLRPAAVFEKGASYSILIDQGAFADLSGQPYAGITDHAGWNFTASLIANPSFEDGLNGWTVEGTIPAAFTEAMSGTHDGEYHGTYWSGAGYESTTKQTADNLANGLYTVKAWVKSGGGHNSAYMFVDDYGGEMEKQDLEATVNNEYTELVFTDVPVTSGKLTIGFYTHSNGGTWIHFDDVELVRNAAPAAKPVADFKALSVKPTKISFGWTQAAGATAVRIEQSADNGKSWLAASASVIAPGAMTAEVKHLKNKTHYQFRLVVDGGINEGKSNVISVTTGPGGTEV